MNYQIIISAKNNVDGNETLFGFTKSKTGQLDYEGKIAPDEKIDFSTWQELESSTYFSPTRYTFIEDSMNISTKISIAPNIDISNKDTFAFITHIGALICAVEAKNSYIAGSLYVKRKSTFDKFFHIVQYIIEPLAVEILFTLCFGQNINVNEDNIPLIFDVAKKKLKFDASSETLAQAFVRYLREHSLDLTLEVQGKYYNRWDSDTRAVERIVSNLNWSDFETCCQERKKIFSKFYSSIKTIAQAEPYNPHDKNAIQISIEDMDSKLNGVNTFVKAGYVRRTGAEILRNAKESILSYNAKLVAFNDDVILVKVTV